MNDVRPLLVVINRAGTLGPGVDHVHVLPGCPLDPLSDIITRAETLGVKAARDCASDVRLLVNAFFHDMLKDLEFPQFRMWIDSEIEGFESRHHVLQLPVFHTVLQQPQGWTGQGSAHEVLFWHELR